jgi:hypothetical protein
MPKLTIEVDEQAWQQLRDWAERQGLTPEALAQQLLLDNLHIPEGSNRRQSNTRKYSTRSHLHEQLGTNSLAQWLLCPEARSSASSPL